MYHNKQNTVKTMVVVLGGRRNRFIKGGHNEKLERV